MKLFPKFTQLAAVVFLLPTLANAEGYSALTFGFGPNGYSSYAFKANAGISEAANLDLDYFRSPSSGGDLRQFALGGDFVATELVAANYHYSNTDDGLFEVNGNEGGLSFALDSLWQGELRTTLDFGMAEYQYQAAKPTAINANKTLTQSRSNAGFSQDITPTLSLYASFDRYQYDRNVTNLAWLLIKRTRNTSQAAYTLLAFPDQSRMLGISWHPSDNLTLDASSGRTVTLLDQEQKSLRLGADYQFSKDLNLAAAVTRSTSTALTTGGGIILQDATSDLYTELTLGWSF